MDDLKPHNHGEEGTHSICRNRLELFGGDGQCCFCKPHTDCLIMKQINERLLEEEEK